MESCAEGNEVHINGFNSDQSKSDNNFEKPTHSLHIKPDLLTLHSTYQNYYKDKIASIANSENVVDREKIELGILKSYLEQLEELNSVLITTMAELQTEVEERVLQMEKRLKSSAKTTMECMVNFHDCEKEMSRLVNEKHQMGTLLEEMQSQISTVTVENNFLRDQNFNLDHDIQALLHIIRHARSSGHWEMDCVTFCEVTPEQVFGPVQSLDYFKKPHVEPVNCNSDYMDRKCLSQKNQHITENHFTGKSNNLQHSVSLPIIEPLPPPSPVLRNFTWSSSKSSSIRIDGLSRSDDLKTQVTQDSCDVTQRTCNDSYLRRAYSEPHLFIFGDSIYVYRPCESPHQDLQAFTEDDGKQNNRACQSIDLRLPNDDITLKYGKSNRKDFFPNSKRFHHCNRASSLSNTLDQASLSSCTSITDYDGDSLVNEEGIQEEECSGNDHCPCLNKPFRLQCDTHLHKQISQSVQTDAPKSLTVGLQSALPDPVLNCATNHVNPQDKLLKENLLRAEDKVSAQVILIKELQSHLNTIMKEMEAKEEKVQEHINQQKILQDQKRSLMTQLDSQGDELVSVQTELQICKRDLRNFATQMDQQSTIIKSLQDALVQSKRALDETKTTNPIRSSNKMAATQPIQTSRNSIVDL